MTEGLVKLKLTSYNKVGNTCILKSNDKSFSRGSSKIESTCPRVHTEIFCGKNGSMEFALRRDDNAAGVYVVS